MAEQMQSSSGLIDVLSPAGLRTGEVLPRSEIHHLGKWHRAVHLYLFNSRQELLLQRRALTVDHGAGLFSISVTGHVGAGEFSAAAVRREIAEELRLDASQLKIDFLFSFFQEAVLDETYIDRQFNDVYVTRADIAPEQIQFDPAEVSEVTFVPFEQFRNMVLNESAGFPAMYAHECREIKYVWNDLFPEQG